MKRQPLFAALLVPLFCTLPTVNVVAGDAAADISAQGNQLRSPAPATRLAALKHLQSYSGSTKQLIQTFTSALADKSPEVRSGAARALADIGLSAREAAPALVPLLTDKDETVRSNAALALGEINAPSDESLSGLALLLHDAGGSVRGQAAQALGKFGPVSEKHRPALLELLKDPNTDVAVNAAIALASTGDPGDSPEAARFYVLALSRDGSARKIAESALRKIGAPSVDALQRVLKKEKELYNRREAAAMLGKLGEMARPAIPTLIEALDDKDQEIQNRAAQALVTLDAAPVEASAAVLRLMKDSNEIRPKALAAFERMNEHAVDLPLALLKTKDDVSARREAARVLCRLAPRFKEHPDILFIGLGDADENVRCLIVQALVNSGANSKLFTAQLISLLGDKSFEVSALACKTLAGIQDDPAAIVALAQTRSQAVNGSVRNEAGRAVLSAGPRALPALSVLREALKNEDANVREWALEALGNIGPMGADAIPDLVACLVRFRAYRLETARALGKMGEKGVDPLMALLSSNDPNIRSNAALALGTIGAPALAKLTTALSDGNPDVVEAALNALERMAPASAPAVPALIRAANSKISKINGAAFPALGKLGPLAVPALLGEIHSADPAARGTGVAALSMTGAKSVPLIVDALRAEQDPGIVCMLLDSLSRMGPAAADAVPAVLETAGRSFGGKDRGQVWSRCASALGSIGSARETSVAVLFGMLSTEEKTAHSDAAAALRKIGGEDLRIPPLSDALRNASPAYVGGALRLFGRAGMIQLMNEMTAGTPEIRDSGARAFVQLVPECVPFLLQAMGDNGGTPEASVQAALEPRSSVGAILAIGEVRAYEVERRAAKGNAKVLEELAKALAPSTAELQKKIRGGTPDEAVAALWALGKADSAGLETLVKNLAACAPDLQPRGIAALSYYDTNHQSHALLPVLPLLLKAAGHPSNIVRKQAAAILTAAGLTAECVPALTTLMEDPEPLVRTAAFAGLRALGAEARAAVPKLIALAEQGPPAMTNQANGILVAIGPDAVPALIQASRSDNITSRANAGAVLVTMATAKAANLTPHLALLGSAAADERVEVTVRSLHLIALLKEAGRPLESKVCALIGRENEAILPACIKTLTAIGANVFDALAPYADQENEERALRVIQALRGAGDAGRVRAFVARQLQNKNITIRAAAVLLLPGKEDGTPESLPLIALAMKDSHDSVRTNGMVWLFDNAPFKPDAALPLLLAGLKDPYEAVNEVASRSLIHLGAKAMPSAPELKKLLTDPRKETAANAARALIGLGVTDEPLAVMICNETNAWGTVTEHHGNQENYFIEHFTEGNVHHYAFTFLETWGAAPKDKGISVDPDGTLNLTGYKLRVLHGQSEHAEGGKKDWVANGKLVGGNALLAWPIEPGVSARVAYMSGPDGALYERTLGPKDTPLLPTMTVFDPGPEWTKTFAPEKLPPRAAPHPYFKQTDPNSEVMEF